MVVGPNKPNRSSKLGLAKWQTPFIPWRESWPRKSRSISRRKSEAHSARKRRTGRSSKRTSETAKNGSKAKNSFGGLIESMAQATGSRTLQPCCGGCEWKTEYRCYQCGRPLCGNCAVSNARNNEYLCDDCAGPRPLPRPAFSPRFQLRRRRRGPNS